MGGSFPSSVVLTVASVTAAGCAVAAVLLAWLLLRERRRHHQAQTDWHRDSADLRDRLVEVRERLTALERTSADHEYVITDAGLLDGSLGDRSTTRPLPPGTEAGSAGERVLALGHGVRRALSAESRNRIAFEMRREAKRARKSRRTETRQALREHRSRARESG